MNNLSLTRNCSNSISSTSLCAYNGMSLSASVIERDKNRFTIDAYSTQAKTSFKFLFDWKTLM